MIKEKDLKAKIKKHLDSIGAYYYMVVPVGYGKQTVDFLCCINGFFISIETKTTGGKPTPRQALCIEEIRDAGGIAFCCDSYETYIEWISYAIEVADSARGVSKITKPNA